MLTGGKIFLSTLSLRRATRFHAADISARRISIHALLAESDRYPAILGNAEAISIHALLAESDRTRMLTGCVYTYFYPRSPCGERRYSLRRSAQDWHFYPRSPCGERQHAYNLVLWVLRFLSTLSLRRATANAVDQILPGHISIHALLAESDRFQAADIS